MIKVGIITISDKGSRGEREDLSVEEIKNKQSLLGFQLFMLPPPHSGIPPIAITPDNVEIYPKKRGGHSPSCRRE